MKYQIQQALDSVLTQPLQQEIKLSAQEKLLKLSQRQHEKKILFKLLEHELDKAKQVIIRIKVLCVLQNLTNIQLQQQNLQKLSHIIKAHQKRLIKRCQKVKDKNDDTSYFQSQVQLPYTIFLRKMMYWRNHQEEENTFDVNQGFSLLNKLKQIFQFKKVFHNYSCYYPSHRYAYNMFRETLSTIKGLWENISYMAQTIISQAVSTNTVLQQQFLFLSAAEEIQQTLVQFLSIGQFSKNVNKTQKIKKADFLKPEIHQLQLKRRNKINESKIAMSINLKRLGRRGEKTTKDSQNIEDKLSTQIETQILDSILRLQSLLIG